MDLEGHEKDPLHGITLQTMLERLLEKHGWEGLAARIPIRCFSSEPSISSSLAFLRRTPWARAKVEKLYLGKLKTPRKRAPAAGPGQGSSGRPAASPAGKPGARPAGRPGAKPAGKPAARTPRKPEPEKP